MHNFKELLVNQGYGKVEESDIVTSHKQISEQILSHTNIYGINIL